MKNEFKIPPVSTLLGSDIKNYRKILKDQVISPEYRLKVWLTSLIVGVSTPFHWWDELVFNEKRLKKVAFKKPPLFILGHWRSGTTLLHNMLSKDPIASYVTTYQTVFPNNMASKAIFRTFMKVAMPNRRPGDNMKLGVSLPQEDEFALSNMYYNNYYNFFYFPNSYRDYYSKSVRFEGITPEEKETWKKVYEKLLKKALIDLPGDRLVLKNPVNTGRVKLLLEMFPDAKFLYIYRNPVYVFLSTHKFFQVILQTLMLHRVTPEFIDDMIFDVYKMLLDDYHRQREFIPKENLYELRYESFEKNPVNYLEEIYKELLNEDFSRVNKIFTSYFESLKGHKKQQYHVEMSVINRITKEWGKYMELYGYDVPKEILVK